MGRLQIGVVDGVFGRSHASAGEEREAAAIDNAIDRGDAVIAGLRVRTGRGGERAYRVRGHGAHSVVALTTAAAIGEDTYYPAPQRLN